MSLATKYQIILVTLLLASLITGIIVLIKEHYEHQPIEITISQRPEPECYGEVYIDGAVASPGVYRVRKEDTIESLILSAGINHDADLSRIKLYIPRNNETRQVQKVNLNLAEAWLICALPTIGPETAQNIVDYRNRHGSFRRLEDLLNVKGIGETTLLKIKDLVTLEE